MASQQVNSDSPFTARRREARTGGKDQLSGDEAHLWQQFTSPANPEAYYRSWLAIQCGMIDDVSHAVVVVGPPDTGPFAPAAFWPEEAGNRQQLAEVAEGALAKRQGLILQRESTHEDGSRFACFHVAYPIQIDGRLYGVAALEIGPRSEPQLRAVMRQLQWGSGWLQATEKRRGREMQGGEKEQAQDLLNLAATLLEQERFIAAATAFVTELATRLECERVSVGFARRKHVQVLAMSHAAQFGKKTNLTRAIEAAMDETLDEEAAIQVPPPPDAPFRVTRAHEELARQHGEGALCSVPLSQHGRVVGVLTLERPIDKPFEPKTVELCEALGALAGPLLEVKRRDDRWLVTKMGESLRTQLGRLFGPSYVGRKLFVAALLAVVVFFVVAEGDYRVTATTVIEPVIRRVAVAPFDGYIGEARVRAGDLVQAGDVLATLDDRDLRLERLKWLSQKQQYDKQYQVAMGERDAAGATIVMAQIQQAKAELELVEDRLARTQIRAPFDAIVVAGDLTQSIGAPVERGQVLFEVAPLDSYRVILQVDEHDIAEVKAEQNGYLVLSTFPTRPLPLKVERITPVSTAREGRNYFRVEAQLDSKPPALRPGMEGVGKLTIDQRSLLWIWTHKAVDWFRLTLWSWWP